MRVVFKQLTIQNLLSFGNTETVIDFTQGLNLITGKNGSGKSSALLDAISFALYDKPYRKINKSDLINRKNKKNLKVSCEFSVNDTEYKIVRGLKNSEVELEFYIDGSKQNLLSTKGLTQDEIENHIGIDYKLFKQIISLSINHNIPFLTLPAQEKRELLEKFFNIDVIASMLKNAKDELKNIKVKKEMINNSVDLLVDVIRSEKKHIQELEESKNNFDLDKKNQLCEIDEQIDLNTRNLKQLKRDGKKKKEELDKLSNISDLQVLKDKKELLTKQINICEYDIKNAEKLLSALNQYDICPTCNSNLTVEHKDREIQLQQQIITTANDNISSYRIELDAVKKQIVDSELILSEEQDIKYNIKYLKNQYMTIESQIQKLVAQREKVQNSKFVVDLDSMRLDYNKKIKEYNDNKSELSVIVKNMSNYTKIIEILSDTGVKSYIFEQLIPVLNKSVNYYLNIFDLPIFIEFDNTMKDNIKTSANFNNTVSYLSFSEGEKKKIDMAILLSFIDVTKKIANWNCNLLIIDELLDSSIDDDGLEKLLESLEKMVIHDKDMGIYIISHRFKSEYKHFFNSMVEISKNANGFSKITEI